MIALRRYGSEGPLVLVLHGGPGAPGSAAGLARLLGRSFRVIEPLQRPSGEVPLSVDRHVEDLEAVLAAVAGDAPCALVGWSWGATLALSYAAAHPRPSRPLVLVGCPTFDERARTRLRAEVDRRLSDEGAAHLARIDAEITDPDRRLAARAAAIERATLVDPLEDDAAANLPVDARAHHETWRDAVRLQEEGIHPAAFRRVVAPVLMLHGAEDPHPGGDIRDSLLPHVPHLEFVSWARCGHSPWRERSVRDAFAGLLEAWLRDRLEDLEAG